MNHFRAGVAMLVLVGGLMTAPLGCRPVEVRPPDPLGQIGETDADVPTFRELAERYNANLARLDQLKASTTVVITWRDDRDRLRSEQGEGLFLYVRPHRTALSMGKPGIPTALLAGSDEERFWLIDRLERDSVSYVGRRANVGRPCSEALPLPVSPEAVPYLMGLLPLDVEASGGVQRVAGGYAIEPAGMNMRLLLDAVTGLPTQVDLTDARGETVVMSTLAEHGRVQVEGLALSLGPKVATRARLFVVGEEGEMRLTLSNMEDGRRFGTIPESSFDFDRLARAYRLNVRDLDANCPPE